jgi:phosphonate transport system permease protein
LLWEAIRSFQFEQTAAIMLVVIVTVSLLDFASQFIRKKYI